MLNQITLIGRLTQDIELRYTSSNIAYTRNSIAVARKYDREITDFIPIVVWRKDAENLARYQRKGSLVSVVGELQQSRYEDSNGNPRTSYEVHSSNIIFLEYNQQEDEERGNRGVSARYNDEPVDPYQRNVNTSNPRKINYEDLSEDDLPF